MKITLLILNLTFSIAISLAQTQEDARAMVQKSDKRLNDAYQMLLAAKRTDTVFIKNLRSSQRLWIQFRDAELTLKFPNHPSFEKDDSLPMNLAIYMADLMESRTQVLLEWIKTATSGLVNYQPLDDKENDASITDHVPTEIYVSDLKIMNSGNVNGGIGLDRPYWADQLIICGKKYMKGIILHPENGGVIAYAEFSLPKPGGRLVGVAGWAEERGPHRGKMRYRILVDGKLLSGNELIGTEYRSLNLQLGQARVLRIETDDGLDGNDADHMAFGDLRIVY